MSKSLLKKTKKKAVSDRYLMMLWRRAVLAEWNYQCGFCGAKNIDLECHHIVKRRRKLTRWDWRNGIPLCTDHHKVGHTKDGELKIMIAIGDARYKTLCEMEKVVFKDYLLKNGMTENEFRINTMKTLKEVANKDKENDR